MRYAFTIAALAAAVTALPAVSQIAGEITMDKLGRETLADIF